MAVTMPRTVTCWPTNAERCPAPNVVDMHRVVVLDRAGGDGLALTAAVTPCCVVVALVMVASSRWLQTQHRRRR